MAIATKFDIHFDRTSPEVIRTSVEQSLKRLRENAGAAHVELTSAEVSALDKAPDAIPMSGVFGGSKIVKKS